MTLLTVRKNAPKQRSKLPMIITWKDMIFNMGLLLCLRNIAIIAIGIYKQEDLVLI